MNTVSLAGSVNPHDKHIFVGLGADTDKEWPHDVAALPYASIWSNAINDFGDRSSCRPRLTASDDVLGSVVIFPDCIRYDLGSHVTPDMVQQIIAAHLGPSSQPG
jgi:hypothetical protein